MSGPVSSRKGFICSSHSKGGPRRNPFFSSKLALTICAPGSVAGRPDISRREVNGTSFGITGQLASWSCVLSLGLEIVCRSRGAIAVVALAWIGSLQPMPGSEVSVTFYKEQPHSS
jgi:hypothetical protein